MNKFPNNSTDIIASKIEKFRTAWNQKDLGAIHEFLSKNIVCKHPEVQIGFINVIKGNHQGYFDVLKFWKQLFGDFNTMVEEVEIHDSRERSAGYRTQCTGHYPNMGLSGKFFVDFDSEFLIERIEFTQFMKYRADFTISNLRLAFKYLKIKGKKLLA